MAELDEIIYEAIRAVAELSGLQGGIHSTCIEVPPMDADNTPLPYIIITDDSLQNQQGTKDEQWESMYDNVQAGVEIAAISPNEVKRLRRLVRRAIARYMERMDEAPLLLSLTNDGIAWDWSKPCYYDTLHYQCEVINDLTD